MSQRWFDNLVLSTIFAITFSLDILLNILIIINLLFLILSKFVVSAVLLRRFGSGRCLIFSRSLNFYSKSISFIILKILQSFFGIRVFTHIVWITATLWLLFFIEIVKSIIKLILELIIRSTKTWQISKTGQTLLFFILFVRWVRLIKWSTFNRLNFLTFGLVLLGVPCIFARILVLTWALNSSSWWSHIVIQWVHLLRLNTILEMWLHLVRAVWIVISVRRWFVILALRLRILPIITNPNLFNHVKDQWFCIVVLASFNTTFSGHLVSIFWEIRMKIHLRNKNGESMFHLIKSQEFSDEFGAEKTIFLGDNLSGIWKLQGFDVFCGSSKLSFPLEFQSFDNSGSKFGLQIIYKSFFVKSIDYSVLSFHILSSWRHFLFFLINFQTLIF